MHRLVCDNKRESLDVSAPSFLLSDKSMRNGEKGKKKKEEEGRHPQQL